MPTKSRTACELRVTELKNQINELLLVDVEQRSEEQVQQLDSLKGQLEAASKDLELAIAAEPTTPAPETRTIPGAEPVRTEIVEYRSLVGRSLAGNFVTAALRQTPLYGAEAELAQHHGLPPGFMPLELLGCLSGNVDGQYATDEASLRVLAAPSIYGRMAAVQDTGGNRTFTQYLRNLGTMIQASANAPAPSGGNVAKMLTVRPRGLAGAAALPIWMGAEIIRDMYTKAATGQVVITINTLMNFAILRADNFAVQRVKTA